jgi:Plasmid pRiA4b ORF-3-like protein
VSHIETDRVGQMLVLRVVVRGVSPLIVRRVVVDVNTTLAALDDVLRVVLGWSDTARHRFRIHGRVYGRVSPAIDELDVGLDAFGVRVGERFVYRHDATVSWIHDVRVDAVVGRGVRGVVPRCVSGRRRVPPPWCADAPAFMAWEDTWSPVAADRVGSLAAVDDMLVDGEQVEMMAWRARDLFDRRTVNRQLAGLARAKVVTRCE